MQRFLFKIILDMLHLHTRLKGTVDAISCNPPFVELRVQIHNRTIKIFTDQGCRTNIYLITRISVPSMIKHSRYKWCFALFKRGGGGVSLKYFNSPFTTWLVDQFLGFLWSCYYIVVELRELKVRSRNSGYIGVTS